MICKNCGCGFKEGQERCPVCGTSITSSNNGSAMRGNGQQQFKQNSLHYNPQGMEQDDLDHNPQGMKQNALHLNPPAPQKGNGKKVALIIAGAAVALLLLIGGIVFIPKWIGGEKTTESAQESTSAVVGTESTGKKSSTESAVGSIAEDEFQELMTEVNELYNKKDYYNCWKKATGSISSLFFTDEQHMKLQKIVDDCIAEAGDYYFKIAEDAISNGKDNEFDTCTKYLEEMYKGNKETLAKVSELKESRIKKIRTSYWDYVKEEGILETKRVPSYGDYGYHQPTSLFLKDCDWDDIPELYISYEDAIYASEAGWGGIICIYKDAGTIKEKLVFSYEGRFEKDGMKIVSIDSEDSLREWIERKGEDIIPGNEEEIRNYLLEGDYTKSVADYSVPMSMVGDHSATADKDSEVKSAYFGFCDGTVILSVNRCQGIGIWNEEGTIDLTGEAWYESAGGLEGKLNVGSGKKSMQITEAKSYWPLMVDENGNVVKEDMGTITISSEVSKDGEESTEEEGTDSRVSEETVGAESKNQELYRDFLKDYHTFYKEVKEGKLESGMAEYSNRSDSIMNKWILAWDYVPSPDDMKYAFLDLDENGTDELLAIFGDEVMAIFTINNGSPKVMTSAWGRSALWVDGNKNVYQSSSDGAYFTEWVRYRVSGCDLIIKESVSTAGEYEGGEKVKLSYYRAEGKTILGQPDQGTKISEEEFEKTLKDWKEDHHSVNDLNVKTYNIKDF